MLRMHATGSTKETFWFLPKLRDQELCKVKRILFLPPVPGMALRRHVARRIYQCCSCSSQEVGVTGDGKSHSPLAGEGSRIRGREGQHRMGSGGMRTLSLPLLREALLQECAALQDL